MKKFLLSIIFIISLLVSIFAPVCAFGALDKSNIVAIVNDTPITKYEFTERKKLMILLFNIDLSVPGIENKVNKEVLRSLIETEVLKQHSQKLGLKVTDQEIKDTIKMLEQQNNMPEGGMRQYIMANGIKFDTFKDQIIGERIKLNIMQSIAGATDVSNSEIEEVLINNSPKDFEIETWVFTSRDADDNTYKMMSKLKSRATNCDKIESKLYDSFADAEKFDRHLTQLNDKIQSVVKDTKVGKSSSIFKDEDKYKLVLVCKKQPINLSEAEEGNIKYYLLNKKGSSRALKLFDDLRQKAYVEIVDPDLK